MISVIIPVYNSQASIAKCIESVISQHFSDLEIIIVDDGSTDNSSKLCDDFANNYPFIRVHHQSNQGSAVARKKGIELACGEYIMFADSDDYYLPESINKLTKDLRDFDIVCGQPTPSISRVSELIILETNEILNAYFNTRILHGSFWGSIFKKSLFENVDFCENAAIGEDVNTILQVYLKSKKIHVITDSVYYYKRNESSISNSGYTNRHKEGLLKYVEYRKFYCNQFPQYGDLIAAFYTEYEMAVFTAMCRNDVYDSDTIELLKEELRVNKHALMHNKSTAFYYKISAILILFNHKFFGFLFRSIRKIVGR